MDYRNNEMEQYLCSHIDAEPELLYELERQTHLRTIQPRMVSGHVQGRLLKMLVRMINPMRVLEVGTFTGYSALCMAEGLMRPDAHVDTIEVDDEMETFIREFFGRSEFADRLTLHIGDAREVIGRLPGEFDLVFLDGDKREYPAYYEMVLPRVSAGGYILADNTLWDGHVLEEPRPADLHTKAVKAFNDMVAADARVEKVIIPMRDGLTVIRKL